jgi:hypothetical protein
VTNAPISSYHCSVIPPEIRDALVPLRRASALACMSHACASLRRSVTDRQAGLAWRLGSKLEQRRGETCRTGLGSTVHTGLPRPVIPALPKRDEKCRSFRNKVLGNNDHIPVLPVCTSQGSLRARLGCNCNSASNGPCLCVLVLSLAPAAHLT